MINENVKANHTYRVTFSVDTIDTYRSNPGRFYHPMDLQPSTSALYVYDETDGNKLVYSETMTNSPRRNLINMKATWEEQEGGRGSNYDYYTFSDDIYTDPFDGIKLNFTDGWLLVRPSGTEPKIRITAEAKSEEKVVQLYDMCIKAIEESTMTGGSGN